MLVQKMCPVATQARASWMVGPKGPVEDQRFVTSRRIETTFQDVRRHLGVETQRQWSDKAILRTTPALLGLSPLVTLWAHELHTRAGPIRPQTAAW